MMDYWRRLAGRVGAMGRAVTLPEGLGQSLRERHGRSFVVTIDPQDEMYRFLVAHPSIREPVSAYFQSGESLFSSVRRALTEAGADLEACRRCLDFASGHGRLTRYLVSALGATRVTVADIDRHAVDFCRRAFGVAGFYSTRAPADLEHGQHYDAILVASLFSHLSIDLWGPWLARLAGLLEPGGWLLFSTHGMHAYGLLDEAARANVLQVRPGFFFVPQSETTRLAPNDYGTTYVTETFVREVVDSLGSVVLEATHPRLLWEFQDGYLLRRPRSGQPRP